MKLKATKQSIKRGYNTIFAVGYCSMQNLLNYQSAFAYSCGVYGWACDYYEVEGVCISTGYQPVGQAVDHKLISEYEQKAESFRYDYSLSYEQQKEKTESLLFELISKLIN